MTCEDRDYRCCEAFPPPEMPVEAAEYGSWYDAHVRAWEAGNAVPEVCPVHGTTLLHYYGTVACGACLEPSTEESMNENEYDGPDCDTHTTSDGEAWWRDEIGTWRDENGLAVGLDELAAEELVGDGEEEVAE